MPMAIGQPEDEPMKSKLSKSLPALMLIAGLATGASAMASTSERIEARINNEVAACASAFRNQVDLDGVNRIRHVVTAATPAIIGREFRLETSTFSGEEERRYRSICLVNGDNPPIRLRVRELSL
jgi:hypothetical protein